LAASRKAGKQRNKNAPVVEFAVLTDTGKVRQKNEDNALAMEDKHVFVVADGMGGHSSGEVASQLSIEAMQAFYGESASPEMNEKSYRAYKKTCRKGERSRSLNEYRLWKSIECANLSIFNTAQRYSQFRDMGTTIVAIHFVGNRVYVGYVGDSRVYRLRKGKFSQITEDHSLANEYVKMKILRKEDVPRFPYKNVIVRALGLSDSVEIDTFYCNSRVDDLYLLCSDGLTDLVTDDDIQDIIESSPNLEVACKSLVDAANALGGVDNITVLAVRVLSPAGGTSKN
jgi:protein phosphatase